MADSKSGKGKGSATFSSEEQDILRSAWGSSLFNQVMGVLDEIPGAISGTPSSNSGVAVSKSEPRGSEAPGRKDAVPAEPATAEAPPEIRREDLIGQKAAQSALEQAISIARLNQERLKRGLPPLQVSLHAAFAGSPGTGKTTFARFYAQEIRKIGLLKKGHLVEVSRSELVGEFAGQTATKTTAVVQKARGGVLFIDEAYSLKNSKDDAFGQECIDTLVKLIEDLRNDIVVILAGYTDEMRQFLHLNTGLKSRIPHFIHFEDYTDEELGRIFDAMVGKMGLQVSAGNRGYLLREIASRRKARSFGNAREVRNLLERALSQQAVRLSKQDLAKLGHDELVTLIYSDFTEHSEDVLEEPPQEARKSDARERLARLAGLGEIKTEVGKLADLVQVAKLRSAAGSVPVINLNLAFAGNPGTGKSTVARLLGEIFRELGVLGSGHVVETDRSGLVGEYVGQTAVKTREKVLESLGGILLVDEAGALVRGAGAFGGDGFGQEAIDSLAKCLEDYRGKFALILAGTPAEMEALSQLSPALFSRVSATWKFPDLSEEELLSIAEQFAGEAEFRISPAGRDALRVRIEDARKDSAHGFANALGVRNLLERAFKRQAVRLLAGPEKIEAGADRLSLLEAEDFTP